MSASIRAAGEAFARREPAEAASVTVQVSGEGEARRAVLYSYATPVAVCDKARAAYFTAQRHSHSTTVAVLKVKAACALLGVRVETLDPDKFAARLGRREGRMS